MTFQPAHLSKQAHCPGPSLCPDNHIIEAFSHGLSLLSQDSLLAVFRDNKDSRQFMFDRIKEILDGCIRTAREGAEALYADARSDATPNYAGSKEMDLLRDENKKLCAKILELSDNARILAQQGYQTSGSTGDDTRELNSLLGIKNPPALMEEKLQLEKQLKEYRVKFAEMQETMKIASENEKNLKMKLELKTKGLEEMRERVSFADRESKKANFEKKECEEILTRKTKLLEEENTILRQKFADLMTGPERSPHQTENKSALKNAEQKSIEYREQARLLQRKLEELEFTTEQNKLSSQTLKQEIQHLNELLKTARSSAYSLEVQLIESRDRESEFKLQICNTENSLNKMAQELNISQSNLRAIEDKHRNEKKRAMELERMNEQLSFTSGRF
jgi:chromosome segregation ATPase